MLGASDSREARLDGGPSVGTPKHVRDLPHSPQEIAAAVAGLEKYSDARWWSRLDDEAIGNVVARDLLFRGTEPASFLAYLSGVLSRIDQFVGFPSKLRDLKGHKSETVLLELEVAALYAAAGWGVSFPREGKDRTPDVLARLGDDEIAVECKTLDGEAWEVWADNLTNQVLFTPPIGGRNDRYVFQIEVSPRLADLRLNPEQYPEANAALREGVVEAVRRALVEVLEPEPELPLEVPIPGIGRATVLPKSTGGQSWISGPEIPSEAKLRRIFTNGVIPASGQLPADKPGIVVVCAEHLGEPAAARLMLDP